MHHYTMAKPEVTCTSSFGRSYKIKLASFIDILRSFLMKQLFRPRWTMRLRASLTQPRSQALSPFPPLSREEKERGPGNEVAR